MLISGIERAFPIISGRSRSHFFSRGPSLINDKQLLSIFVVQHEISANNIVTPEQFPSTVKCRIMYQLYIVAGNTYAGAKVWKSSFLAICKMQVPAHQVARCESGGAICTESKGSTLVSRGRALSPCTRPLLVPH